MSCANCGRDLVNDHTPTGLCWPHWIPVTERLPEVGVVLAFNSEGFFRVYEAEGLSRYPPGNVTHWMPLPEPPE